MVLKKVKAGYDFGKTKGCINHLFFMDDLKLYAKNERQLNFPVFTVQVCSRDFNMESGITKR